MQNLPTINQNSNQVSRRLGKLNRELKQKLETFYRKHIKGSNAPIGLIRQKYGKEIEQIIRNYVQTSWLFAHDIVGNVTGETINISVKDVQGIEKTSEILIGNFWHVSNDNLQREHEFKVNESGELIEQGLFDLSAAMNGLSLLFLFYSFNQAMTSKAEELHLKLKFVTRENCIDTKICLPLKGMIFEVGQVLYNPPLHKHCKCRLIPVLS